MKRSDFFFDLPESLIAQHPPKERGQSRLLDCSQLPPTNRKFSELPNMLRRGDLLVVNNTKVIKARLYGQKETGGRIEVMVERIMADDRVTAMIRASKSPKIGSKVLLPSNTTCEVIAKHDMLYELKVVRADLPLMELLDAHGQIPLPPYITHEAEEEDEQRYQTVYANAPGAVAAPTAGLHFTDKLMSNIADMGVCVSPLTLHVGAGTFLPVKVDDIAQHTMHRERYELSGELIEQIASTRKTGGRVIAVGTTSLRALEAWAKETNLAPYSAPELADKGHRGDTDIFITPGFSFRVVDALITNFHLPESTLLMLVSAFSGIQHIQRCYQHAIAHQYRFFSYGDAMWLTQQK